MGILYNFRTIPHYVVNRLTSSLPWYIYSFILHRNPSLFGTKITPLLMAYFNATIKQSWNNTYLFYLALSNTLFLREGCGINKYLFSHPSLFISHRCKRILWELVKTDEKTHTEYSEGKKPSSFFLSQKFLG